VLQKSLYFKGKKFSTARVSIFFLSSWVYTEFRVLNAGFCLRNTLLCDWYDQTNWKIKATLSLCLHDSVRLHCFVMPLPRNNIIQALSQHVDRIRVPYEEGNISLELSRAYLSQAIVRKSLKIGLDLMTTSHSELLWKNKSTCIIGAFWQTDKNQRFPAMTISGSMWLLKFVWVKEDANHPMLFLVTETQTPRRFFWKASSITYYILFCFTTKMYTSQSSAQCCVPATNVTVVDLFLPTPCSRHHIG